MSWAIIRTALLEGAKDCQIVVLSFYIFFLRLEGEEEVSHRGEENVSQLGSLPSLLPSHCPSAYLYAYQGICLTLGPAVGYTLFSKVSEADRRFLTRRLTDPFGSTL